MKNLSSPSQNVLPKIILLPHLKKMSIPLKRGTSITPPPHLYPNHHAPDVFLSFQFPILKKNDNTQLCTGKIRAIPSNNIENRSRIIKQTIINYDHKISVHYKLSPTVK